MNLNLRRLAMGALLGGLVASAQATEIRSAPSCTQWLKSRAELSHTPQTHKLWLVSFLSGMAVGSGKDILKGVDNDLLYIAVDRYCRASPSDDLSEVAMKLFTDMSGRI